MKIVIHIFTIYMIALALVPCGDGGGGIVEILNHLSGVEHEHIADHDQHSNDCGDDMCTPFCICSCCSSTVDVPVELPFQLKSLPPKPENKPSFFSNVLPTSFHHSIWQPPRFS